jgi:hypothetical protein
MTNPAERHHHVEIKEGDETVAAADVTIPAETDDTAQASLRSSSGHVPPGRRASLVDAVMDLPEVQDSSRLEAAVPLGDSETLGRLRERSENSTTRPAGSSALVDADIPAPAADIPAPAGDVPGPAGDVPGPPAGDVPPAALGEVPPAPAGDAAPPPAE